MLDFLQHFFVALFFVGAIFLLSFSFGNLIELAIRTTVSDEFSKMEQRFREREEERREREQRQRDHEQHLRDLRSND